MRKSIQILAVLSAALLAGCSTDYYQRNDGVSGYAGNAIAANTVLQMVDPWQRGVEDTDIETAAERVSEDSKPKKEEVAAPETMN